MPHSNAFILNNCTSYDFIVIKLNFDRPSALHSFLNPDKYPEMNFPTNKPPDRSNAIKTLIERWIEKNKIKQPVGSINLEVIAKVPTDKTQGK